MFSVTWLKHLGVQDWCGSVTQRTAGSQSRKHLPGAGQTRPTPAERSFGEIRAWGQTCTSYGRTSLNYHLPPRGCAWPCPLKNWKLDLGTVQENLRGRTSPVPTAGMSYANDRILPSYIPGTLTGWDSPIWGMGFSFQHSASCPGILLALLRPRGV